MELAYLLITHILQAMVFIIIIIIIISSIIIMLELHAE